MTQGVLIQAEHQEHTGSVPVEGADHGPECLLPRLNRAKRYCVPDLHVDILVLAFNHLGVEFKPDRHFVVLGEDVLDVPDDQGGLAHPLLSDHDHFEADLAVQAVSHRLIHNMLSISITGKGGHYHMSSRDY